MTKTDAKKRIMEAIKNLNAMENKACFHFEETEDSVEIVCRSKTQINVQFGAYSYMALFDEYKNKLDAYINCMRFAEMLIAATKLNNPKAYHNLAF